MPIGTAVIKRLSVVLAEHELPPYFVQLLMQLHDHDGDIAWWRRYFSRDTWPFTGSGTSNAVDLSKIEILVLDEADRMLDMGFIHDIRRVLAKLPAKRQNLLFSATFSDEIKGLASKLLHNPASVEVARRNTASEQIAVIRRQSRSPKAFTLSIKTVSVSCCLR